MYFEHFVIRQANWLYIRVLKDQMALGFHFHLKTRHCLENRGVEFRHSEASVLKCWEGFWNYNVMVSDIEVVF